MSPCNWRAVWSDTYAGKGAVRCSGSRKGSSWRSRLQSPLRTFKTRPASARRPRLRVVAERVSPRWSAASPVVKTGLPRRLRRPSAAVAASLTPRAPKADPRRARGSAPRPRRFRRVPGEPPRERARPGPDTRRTRGPSCGRALGTREGTRFDRRGPKKVFQVPHVTRLRLGARGESRDLLPHGCMCRVVVGRRREEPIGTDDLGTNGLQQVLLPAAPAAELDARMQRERRARRMNLELPALGRLRLLRLARA